MAPEAISVIIPTYNASSTIEKCLESVLNQNCPNLEIIVVDDASTDDTLEKVSKYPDPVKLFTKTNNQGVAHSRNLGVEKAGSGILIFVDSDIVVPTGRIFQLVNSLKEKPGILAVAGIYSDNTKGFNFISDFKNLDLAYRGQLCGGYVKYFGTAFFAIKKSTFIEAGGFSIEFKGATAEDLDFGYKVSKGKPVMFSDKSISVDHLKKYSLLSMLKTDFQRIINMMRIVKVSGGRYKAGEHAPLYYYLNPILAGLFFLLLILSIKFRLGWVILGVTLAFVINNSSFLSFLFKKRGIIFTLKSVFVLLIEYTFAAVSIFLSLVIPSKNG